MFLHRNSQKRFYDPDTVYFVTSKVHDNQPVFNESIFADLFIAELRLCRQLKGFSLYSFCLLPDHFHLLLKPGDGCNISRIMKLLKGNLSRDINYLIFGHCNMEGDTSMCRLPIRRIIQAAQERLLKRFPRPSFRSRCLGGKNPFTITPSAVNVIINIITVIRPIIFGITVCRKTGAIHRLITRKYSIKRPVDNF